MNPKAMQQMQAKMMERIAKMQEDLQNSTFQGSSGGGAVTVAMNGKFEVTAVKLTPEVVDPADVSMLEDLIMAAWHDAFEKVGEEQAKLMSSLTGGLNLPPGFGF